LPKLPEAEIRRQILVNDEANRHYLGDAYQRRGIFLPEMAYHPRLAPILEDLGFDWVMLDELAYNGRVDQVDYHYSYQIEGTKLKAFFREHRLSDTLMAAATHNTGDMKAAIGPGLREARYYVTGMDGETFGHHRIGHERMLLAMVADPEFNMVRMSELLELYPKTKTVKTVASTWASNEADLQDNIPYISWDDPANELHRLQWQLVDMAITELAKLPTDYPDYERLRSALDPALSSDPFFWAAARPWWMIEHIERGANMLRRVIEELPTASFPAKQAAADLYHHIVDTAWDWQRSGKIDTSDAERAALVRIPFRERTLEQGSEGKVVWDAFMHLFSERERKAAARHDYEAAALWRDAKFKLEQRLDIYDAFHVIDMLRAHLPNKMVEDALEQYRKEYNHIRGGQSEQRSH
jgi:hypothetical protein